MKDVSKLRCAWLLVVALLCLGAAATAGAVISSCQRGFSAVAPEQATAGRDTVVLISLLGAAAMRSPANVTLRLLERATAGSAQQLLTEVTQRITGLGTIPLRIPADADGSYELHTQLEYNQADECAQLHVSPLHVSGAVRDIVLRTSSHRYHPEQLVRFWALAVDPELRLPRPTRADVYVVDPHGNKVAFWTDTPLEQGVNYFEMKLSKSAPFGQWRAVTAVGESTFTQPFDVVSPDLGPPELPEPHRGPPEANTLLEDGLPEVAMAEEHFVELKFGRGMRHVYKPGLPFVGNIVAVSTETTVRVRVKVYDNTTAIYSQDIEISSGVGSFVVPAVLADSDVITIQAELVSVEGKEIDSHYVLAKQLINKWQSASDCYLLVEGIDSDLLPDQVHEVHVVSTCSCELPLHYVITTNGKVTYWSQHPTAWPGVNQEEQGAEPAEGPEDGSGATGFCRLNFSFSVQAQMAPTSSLLVYYVTAEGEPISDVITFTVSLVHPLITLSVEERDYWMPSQDVNVGISSPISSLVCLIGGRNALPNSKMLLSADRSPSTGTGSAPAPAPTQSWGTDFLAAGMNLFQRRPGQTTEFYSHGGEPGAQSWPLRTELFEDDMQLDQLWVWKCFNFSDEMIGKGVVVPAPDEPGKWTLRALTISPSSAMRVSAASHVTVFRPIRVTLRLPTEIRVGETVQVDIRITNHVDECVDVTALLSLGEGAHFVATKTLFVTEKLRLGPRGDTSLVVRLLATTPGLKNMTAEVSSIGSDSCRESNHTSNASQDSGPLDLNLHTAATTTVTATTTVLPEGLLHSDTESAYFCANENVLVSPAGSARYEWVPAPRNRQGLVFEVKAGSGARIALSEFDHVVDPVPDHVSASMYQLVIGDDENTVTWVGRGAHGFGVHLAQTLTMGLLSRDQFRPFWLSWAHGSVTLGVGPIMGSTPLVTWRTSAPAPVVRHVGFATKWTEAGQFRVWNFNDEAGFSQVLHLDLPVPRSSVLPGTEQGTLVVAGGLTHTAWQPQLNGPASLSVTIASLAPLMCASDSSETEDVSEQLSMRLQDLMSFRKADSSFGEHPTSGSHHSTALVLWLLSRAQTRGHVDPDLVARTKGWLQRRQLDDGRFTSDYRDDYPGPGPGPGKPDASSPNTLAQLTLERDVVTTSETVAALLEVGVDDRQDADVVLKARLFLERNVFRVSKPCPVSLMAYALVASKSDLLTAALDRLRNVSTNEEGEFAWPRPQPPKDNPDWLYEESSSRHNKEPIRTSVSEYRAALYALKTYSLVGELKAAESVARYLFYRSHLLDTHSELALHAAWSFSAFGALAVDTHRSLTVSLATSGMELTDTLELRTPTAPQLLQLPSLPTKVFVYATGAGCATVRGRVSYSSYAAVRRTALLDIWAGVEEEVQPPRESLDSLEGKLPTLRLRTCVRWKGSEPSGLLRLEVTLFSGFQLLAVLPPAAHEQRKQLRFGSRDSHVWFINTAVKPQCSWCVRFTARSEHLVGALRPALATVFPVQRPDLSAHTFFHSQSGSPLLNEVTVDDLITWFAREDSDKLEHSSNFSEVDMCVQENFSLNSLDSSFDNISDRLAAEVSGRIFQENTTSQDVANISQRKGPVSTSNGTTSQQNGTTSQPNSTTTVLGLALTNRGAVLDVKILNDTLMAVNMNTKKNEDEKKPGTKKTIVKVYRKGLNAFAGKMTSMPTPTLKSTPKPMTTPSPTPTPAPKPMEKNQDLARPDSDVPMTLPIPGLVTVNQLEVDEKKQAAITRNVGEDKNEI